MCFVCNMYGRQRNFRKLDEVHEKHYNANRNEYIEFLLIHDHLYEIIFKCAFENDSKFFIS